MAEIKFSCPQCGQHISGNEQWSGRQIPCPACATTLTVPQALPSTAAAARLPQSLVPQPPVSHGPKLSAGATQVARSTAAGTIPIRQLAARPPRNESHLLKYVVYAILLAALGGAGYIFLPSLLSKVQHSMNSKPTQAKPASNGSGTGPLGEVNGAMDVSDVLDGGSASTPRPAAARQPVAAQTPTTPPPPPRQDPLTTSPRRSTNGPPKTDPTSNAQQ